MNFARIKNEKIMQAKWQVNLKIKTFAELLVASNKLNPHSPVDINLNAEHDILYDLVMAWLKNQK